MDPNSPYSPSPSIRVGQSSPLDSLVRRASSRRVKVAKLADALNVPYASPQQNQLGLAAVAPLSPLLHTKFRGSVSTYNGSIAGDSHVSGSWDAPSRLPTTTRSYQPPDSRAVSMASQYSVDSHSHSSMPYGGYQPDSEHNSVPTVIVSEEPATPPPPSSAMMRQPSGPPSPQPSRPPRPPIGSEEQKRLVLQRHANPQGGTPTSSRRPSAASEQPRPAFQHPNSSTQLPRTNSQLSVYTSYSYYPYDGQIPSPSASSAHLSPTVPSPTISVHPPPSPAHDEPGASMGVPSNPQTPQEFLQLGIQHHLANRLTESAACFEKSATLNGGCGTGMLMWGLAQRHGWGCPQSEEKGFKWLRKAAELAVDDLEHKRPGMDSSVIKSELVIAIYEVGQSFFRGWGVEKDKKMAVRYFKLAAELGDPDAQQELAFCLANGKGCKKDRKEAAKWYRAAVAQGVSDVGLAWIYKEKFQ
ncbi:hypothetical protein BDY19DRAFT_941321 [Irpex rosettiformis]|uniref:Uncharacterized protein n=1 Tax=Irpex rosettiformis TaxID=378272 RepID=A0ACB8U6C2_9APHY|nr:hypothetical protein BDY19DRAFT_941321 [Irpex rosettiformis]